MSTLRKCPMCEGKRIEQHHIYGMRFELECFTCKGRGTVQKSDEPLDGMWHDCTGDVQEAKTSCDPLPARLVPVEYWAGSAPPEPQAHQFLGINRWAGDVAEAEEWWTT